MAERQARPSAAACLGSHLRAARGRTQVTIRTPPCPRGVGYPGRYRQLHPHPHRTAQRH
jgi:hypothetical protein